MWMSIWNEKRIKDSQTIRKDIKRMKLENESITEHDYNKDETKNITEQDDSQPSAVRNHRILNSCNLFLL